MKKPNQIFSTIIALASLFILCAGIYWGINALLDKLNSLNSDLSKTIIGASFTVIGATLAVVIGKIWEQKNKIKQDVWEKKIPVYEEQIQAIFKTLFAHKEGKQNEIDQELMNAFRVFTEKLIIWGDTDVIKAWQNFRTHPWAEESAAGPEGFMKFEKFVLALRKDLGHDNSKLAKGDLLRLFINDYDDSMTNKK